MKYLAICRLCSLLETLVWWRLWNTIVSQLEFKIFSLENKLDYIGKIINKSWSLKSIFNTKISFGNLIRFFCNTAWFKNWKWQFFYSFHFSHGPKRQKRWRRVSILVKKGPFSFFLENFSRKESLWWTNTMEVMKHWSEFDIRGLAWPWTMI